MRPGMILRLRSSTRQFTPSGENASHPSYFFRSGREMWRVGTPPIRMINIAKTYRPNWDASHTPMFFQFEGLCVDQEINITHLKGTLDHFVKEYFGPNIEGRLRPHHFQFTEPSFEVDVTCTVCNGTAKVANAKCKVCKSGWLELGEPAWCIRMY